jgi:alpha-ketoglutarate-dependent 2,4-dichlorophenoxyacetate dioxygenase
MPLNESQSRGEREDSLDATVARFTVHPLTRHVGAEVRGLDLKRPLEDATIAALNAAFLKHAVLVFRAQNLDDAQQIAFTTRFGPLEDSRVRIGDADDKGPRVISDLSNLDEDGEIVDPDSRKLKFLNGNLLWHTDSSFKPVPAGPSFLTGRIVPPEGGDTEFADLRAAYDALPEAKRRQIDGLVAEHSLIHSRRRYGFNQFTEAERKHWPPVFNPLVRRHPETGRKTLFVGAHAGRIVGMDDADGAALIDELIAFATQPEFVYAHRWTLGDLVMWDNRCCMHRGRLWDQQRYPRNVKRTTVAGIGPLLADGKPVDEYERAQRGAA